MIDINQNFCILHIMKWINMGGYKKVALQFPDELLDTAPIIASSLEEGLGFHVYILGDTTFSSCCIDEVPAEHVGADAIVHFGRTCLSPPQRFPVLYVLSPPVPIDSNIVLDKLKVTDEPPKEKELILVYDTSCFHAIDLLSGPLKELFPNLCISGLDISEKSSFIHSNSSSISTLDSQLELDSHISNSSNLKKVNFNGRKVYLPHDKSIENYDFIYLGPDSPSLESLCMRFSERTFYQVDGSGHKLKIKNSIKQVMSRSGKIEQIKEAKIIGILVGTLGVKCYNDIIARLKKIIKRAGKKYYTFIIGKPNEPKLANIVGIDVFVYISCPESALFNRNENPYLYRHLVTPWELVVGLDPLQEWSLEFEMDFKELLPKGRIYQQEEESIEDDCKIYNLSISEEKREVSSKALMAKPEGHLFPIHEDGAGAILKSLHWQGLNPDETPSNEIGTVVEGRKGIASQYEDEV